MGLAFAMTIDMQERLIILIGWPFLNNICHVGLVVEATD